MPSVKERIKVGSFREQLRLLTAALRKWALSDTVQLFETHVLFSPEFGVFGQVQTGQEKLGCGPD